MFGRRRADKLRALSDTLRTQDMDDAITAMMDAALAERNIHATRFPFANENGNGYSHSIWLASKNPKACQVMRRIMNKRSTATQSGPQTLGFNPTRLTDGRQAQLALIPAAETPWRENLMRDLRKRYSGDPISTREVILRHHRYTNYRDETYKSVITEMEEVGLVTCNPPAHLRRKRNGVVTLGDDVVLHFRPLERSC
jgi:hypothetical protein